MFFFTIKVVDPPLAPSMFVIIMTVAQKCMTGQNSKCNFDKIQSVILTTHQVYLVELVRCCHMNKSAMSGQLPLSWCELHALVLIELMSLWGKAGNSILINISGSAR